MNADNVKKLVYLESWIGNYLEAMVQDQPHHAKLLETFNEFSGFVLNLRKDNSAMEMRINLTRQALGT
jgi:hypothetical protein